MTGVRRDCARYIESILNEVGHVYAPALLANAQAMQAGEKTWETEIDGSRWTQQTFNYQGKCLQWINPSIRHLAKRTGPVWITCWQALAARRLFFRPIPMSFYAGGTGPA